MPGSLFDTNLWVALSFGTHPHFSLAKAAFHEADSGNPAVFCRATQQSFLRHLSSSKLQIAYGAPSISNALAWEKWEELSALPQVTWLEEATGLTALWHQLASRATASPNVWMDAYLAAFAIAGGLQLVTLDKDFKSYEAQGLDLLLLS